jgi:hypothetical protein
LVVVVVVGEEEGGGGTGEEEDGVLLEAARGEEGATVAVGMAEGRTVVVCWVGCGGGTVSERIHGELRGISTERQAPMFPPSSSFSYPLSSSSILFLAVRSSFSSYNTL